jgi:nucleotide-binding universal stress UspA family protein
LICLNSVTQFEAHHERVEYEERAMRKVLVAVDGSASSERAVRHLIAELKRQTVPAEVHVLFAQSPVPERLWQLGEPEFMERVRREEAQEATATADKLLSDAALPHVVHLETGQPAETIVSYAKHHDCAEIVMGTQGMGTVKNLLLGSVAAKVVHAADVPVTLVK